MPLRISAFVSRLDAKIKTNKRYEKQAEHPDLKRTYREHAETYIEALGFLGDDINSFHSELKTRFQAEHETPFKSNGYRNLLVILEETFTDCIPEGETVTRN